MRFKYLIGLLLTNIYRYVRIFPNSDPIMGFVLPAAKNEAWWKAPLFAFTAMFTFGLITNFGIWTWVVSLTYAGIALLFHFFLKNKKSSFKLFIGSGAIGVLIFDFITGPIMTSLLFGRPFIVTTIMQIPFTLMHLVSVTFGIVIISPFLDPELNKEVTAMLSTAKNIFRNWRIQL